MRTIQTTIFKFDELSDVAKEKAREWYRQDLPVDYEFVYADAATIADLMGLDICQTRKTLVNGEHYYAPTIYWSGFWSQGDGACFEGEYRYKTGALKAVKAYAPTDMELHNIAKRLQDLQKRYFYKLTASVKHRGHYYHERSMTVSVDCHIENFRYVDLSDAENELVGIFADFASWIYKRLREKWDYQNSDENVDESIRINEYEFTEDGELA